MSPPSSIAHYKITGKLGEGGMGAVYRATDTKLNREVAIKVIPGTFASDPERIARFTREAQVLASLNHPNIAQIYGVEENAIVMELVEGATLAERIAAGPIPVEEALVLARQITDALEAAHEKGIIHRDLKPANVKITPEGKAKVLDFGLAKALSGGTSNSDPSDSPTLTDATSPGAILGTATYMSPEQARGKPSDKRTDVWSFGCVLYEMLTGQKAFAAETISDTIAKILGFEPDWQQLPAKTPPAIPILLRRCLQEDLGRRLRDVGDARLEIEEALAVPSNEWSATPAAIGARPAQPRSLIPWSIAAIVVVIVGAAVWNSWRAGRPTSRPLTRMALTLPAGEPLWIRVGSSVAISPDGTRVVYVASRGGSTQLYLRAMDQFEAAPIPGTEGAEGPFFSPDGQWVGFFADHKLKKVALRGGAPSILCGAPVSLGASWGPDDTIVFGASPDSGLLRVAGAGGVPEVLTTSDVKNGESGHYWPEILPGGKTVLYTVVTNSGDAHIAARRLDAGQSRILIQGGISPHYASTGHTWCLPVGARCWLLRLMWNSCASLDLRFPFWTES
jgi:predicted Ser/Thr protein kinase